VNVTNNTIEAYDAVKIHGISSHPIDCYILWKSIYRTCHRPWGYIARLMLFILCLLVNQGLITRSPSWVRIELADKVIVS